MHTAPFTSLLLPFLVLRFLAANLSITTIHKDMLATYAEK